MKYDVVDINGKKVEEMELPDSLFFAEDRPELVHEVVVALQANRRSGSASTKDRSEVSGGGRKPWRQKGTGRARHGTIRSPIWRGGGITFGPRPRKYTKHIPKKVRRTALFSLLSNRTRNKKLVIVDKFELEEYKTKRIAKLMDDLGVEGKVLFVLEGFNGHIFSSTANLPWVNALDVGRLNAYDVASHDQLVMTKNSVQRFVEVHTG